MGDCVFVPDHFIGIDDPNKQICKFLIKSLYAWGCCLLDLSFEVFNVEIGETLKFVEMLLNHHVFGVCDVGFLIVS